MENFEVLTVSSLEKVLPSEKSVLLENQNVCFQNELFSFQVAYFHHTDYLLLHRCTWEVEGDLKEFVTVRPVALMPCSTAVNNTLDEYYLTHSATLMPDLLSEEKAFFCALSARACLMGYGERGFTRRGAYHNRAVV